MMELGHIYNCDCLEGLKQLDDESVNCCVSSPPYWGLRDYGTNGQMGLEPTPDEYIMCMVEVFHEVKRVLRDDGTLWVNIGDSYSGGGRGSGYSAKQDSNAGTIGMPKSIVPAGLKHKDLVGIPWMLAFALRADGWYLRQDIIWAKPNPMPESVTDRCTKSHEYIFLLSKSPQYWYDAEAIKEPSICGPQERTKLNGESAVETKLRGHNTHCGTRYGGNKYTADPDVFSRTKSGNLYEPTATRNKRDVWTVPTEGFSGAHFAVYPEALIRPCILAGCPVGGIVLDPFMGSGTTAKVALDLRRQFIGFELSADYCKIANDRIDMLKRQSTLC